MSLPTNERQVRMRHQLRKLYEDDPESFTFWMEEMRGADDWQKKLPEAQETRGKPVKVNDTTLAFLLAEYRLSRDAMTREEFISDHAQGVEYRTQYAVGQWSSEENVRSYLKKAERKAKESEAFCEDVDFRQSCLEFIRNKQ